MSSEEFNSYARALNKYGRTSEGEPVPDYHNGDLGLRNSLV